MAANQDDVANLNKLIDEIMRENVEAVEEILSEHQSEAEINMEQETENAEGEEQNIEQRTEKRQRITEPTEDDQAFISDEAHGLWKKVYSDKSFVGERGFGKLISPFSEAIEKRGWGLFYEHKAPGFAAVVREFYANLVGMREDNTVFVRGAFWCTKDKRGLQGERPQTWIEIQKDDGKAKPWKDITPANCRKREMGGHQKRPAPLY